MDLIFRVFRETLNFPYSRHSSIYSDSHLTLGVHHKRTKFTHSIYLSRDTSHQESLLRTFCFQNTQETPVDSRALRNRRLHQVHPPNGPLTSRRARSGTGDEVEKDLSDPQREVWKKLLLTSDLVLPGTRARRDRLPMKTQI